MRAVLTRIGMMCMLVAACNGEPGNDLGPGTESGTGGNAATAPDGGVTTGAGGGATAGTGGADSRGVPDAGGTGTGGPIGAGGQVAGTGGKSDGGAVGGGAVGGGAVGTTGPGGAAGTPTGGTTASATGTIVPLYTPPNDSSWSAIATAKMAHPTVPVIAVVNPSNGPGPARDAGYADGIGKLQLAGIRVIGYVSTDYTRRTVAAVETDVDRWKSFYPALQGIFFDEQSNRAGDEGFYSTVSQYAKSKGLSFTVGNPGADTGPSFVGAVDVGLIYESFGVPGTNRLTGWHTSYPRTNFGIIPYGAAALDHAYVKQAKAYVGYIYITNDNLPNPWDSLPPYFAALLADLE